MLSKLQAPVDLTEEQRGILPNDIELVLLSGVSAYISSHDRLGSLKEGTPEKQGNKYP